MQSDLSGHIAISGIPKAMAGSADLQLGAGLIGGEPFQSIVVRATFSGSAVNLENVDARLAVGRLTAKGTFNTETHLADLDIAGQSLQLGRLAALIGSPALQTATGTADLSAHLAGNLLEQRSELRGTAVVARADGKVEKALENRSVARRAL